MEQENETAIRQLIKRALENSWEDGKRRDRLRQVIEDRMNALGRVTGFVTIDALKSGDRAQYNRFLQGCERAFKRDGMISAGLLDKGHLIKMKDSELMRRHHAENTDLHSHFTDIDGDDK